MTTWELDPLAFCFPSSNDELVKTYITHKYLTKIKNNYSFLLFYNNLYREKCFCLQVNESSEVAEEHSVPST